MILASKKGQCESYKTFGIKIEIDRLVFILWSLEPDYVGYFRVHAIEYIIKQYNNMYHL